VRSFFHRDPSSDHEVADMSKLLIVECAAQHGRDVVYALAWLETTQNPHQTDPQDAHQVVTLADQPRISDRERFQRRTQLADGWN
jgi:hypothetical protein